MEKVLWFVFFVAVFANKATADIAHGHGYNEETSEDNDFHDTFNEYSEENNADEVINDKVDYLDEHVIDEIKAFIEENRDKPKTDGEEKFETWMDYVLEDNRSNTEEKEDIFNKNETITEKNPLGDKDDEDNVPSPDSRSVDEILKEFTDIVNDNETADTLSDNEKVTIDQALEEELLAEKDAPLQVITEIPLDILEEMKNESITASEKSDSNIAKMFDEASKLLQEGEANILNADEDKNDDTDIQDYEEKHERPYGEGYITSLRDDYEDFYNSNDSEIIVENQNNPSSLQAILPLDDIYDNLFDEDPNDIFVIPTEIIEENISEADEINEKQDIVSSENDQEPNTTPKSVSESYIEEVSPVDNVKTDYEKLMNTDTKEISDNTKEEFDQEIPHFYGNDGLVDGKMPKEEEAEVFLTTTSPKTEASDKESIVELNKEVTTTAAVETLSTLMVDDLNKSQYNNLMSQFASEHNDVIHKTSDNIPTHVRLSLDEPTVVTSPNYPFSYPSNTIVDWIIDGPGMGIEMNVTHLNLNGPMWHYLLVKPGGIDATGSDGLIFSFRLSSERRYRFTNVNRMFVRFESTEGIPLSGFSFSAKMIWPPTEVGEDVIPDPEPILQPPTDTFTLSLAGLTLMDFHKIRQDFKTLVADMAEQYIADNRIDPGLNTTLEVTQITRAAVCNVRWPNFETCVEVSFGVPLHYAEEVEEPKLDVKDLDAMWRTYIVKEPFATRLRDMQITEYAIPNDRSVLMLWLVVASAVVIAMALLGFTMWRFSCLESYTRMKPYDTDSVLTEKRNMDLYPTPHQALPPLYSDTDYKWVDDKYDDAARVDMGGFTNKSYMRDDLFDLDSDEDIITTRDRNGIIISTKDVYDA